MRFEMRQPPPNYVVLSLRSRGDIYDLQAQRINHYGTLAQFCVYTRRASHAPRAGRTYFAATTISRGAGAPPAPRAGGGTKLERRLPCNLWYLVARIHTKLKGVCGRDVPARRETRKLRPLHLHSSPLHDCESETPIERDARESPPPPSLPAPAKLRGVKCLHNPLKV